MWRRDNLLWLTRASVELIPQFQHSGVTRWTPKGSAESYDTQESPARGAIVDEGVFYQTEFS